jgi:D-alanyl-D-alanine carboxypeptidase
MLMIRTGACRGLRCVSFGFATALFALGNLPVAAAPYSDIVVDANSGNVLHATSPDSTRHPASLTKIMTLYLLFEQLEAGKLKLDSPLNVSEHAASQSPTKLGLKAGSTIQVEDAIKGIVTRSANDAAVVIGEAIAGDEQEFAKLMTRKAQALGMTRTVYKNASGLPDDDQVTTARDQSVLGRAIQERFPRYYKYFSTRSFTFRGQRIGNHNSLLGRVEGVDGIKTGYIRASGFNLVTSVHRGNRYLVAVVMGGNSAGSRDARMRDLISKQITVAATKRTAPVMVESTQSSESVVLAQSVGKPEPKRTAKTETAAERKPEATPKAKAETQIALAAISSKPAGLSYSGNELSAGSENASAERAAHASVPIGSTEPIQPVLVKTLAVRAGRPQAAAPASLAPVQMAFVEEDEQAAEARSTTAENKAEREPEFRVSTTEASRAASARKTVAPSEPVSTEPASKIRSAAAAETRPVPPDNKPKNERSDRTARAEKSRAAPEAATAATATEPSAKLASAASKPRVRSGWVIQVGAFQAEEEAKQRLSRVQSKASKVLDGADPFTESVDKGGTTYYRARFAGLDKEQAEAACKYLKRNDVECVTTKY